MWGAFDVDAVVQSLGTNAAVVAGGAGTDRRVVRARIAATFEDFSDVGAHDLVVTTAAALQGAGEQSDQLVARLDAAGVAAIALQREPAVTFPDGLCAAADRLALPIIALVRATSPAAGVNAVLGALLVAQTRAVAVDQERFAATSLEELIAGHVGHGGDIVDVTERAMSFGWDLTRPRAVLLASVDPPAEPGALSPTLATIAAAARATLGEHAVVWTRSTAIAALVAPDTDSPGERRVLAEGLRHELDRRVRAATISIGVGRVVEDPAKLPDSYTEACRAVAVGRWAKGRHVTAVYDELGLERLLASSPADDLAEFVEHSIGRLIDHDREHGSDLLTSLAMWLTTRNMAEAARRMHVHYNTFKNRLDRVESIVGPLVNEPARSLECDVAIYVYRHYDGPWNPPSV